MMILEVKFASCMQQKKWVPDLPLVSIKSNCNFIEMFLMPKPSIWNRNKYRENNLLRDIFEVLIQENMILPIIRPDSSSDF